MQGLSPSYWLGLLFIVELKLCASERICGGNDVSGFAGF